jgi:hypothetical protein
MDAIRGILQAQWDLTYADFCRYLDLGPATEYTRRKWDEFQKLAALLKGFDNGRLQRLADYRPGMVPSAR